MNPELFLTHGAVSLFWIFFVLNKSSVFGCLCEFLMSFQQVECRVISGPSQAINLLVNSLSFIFIQVANLATYCYAHSSNYDGFNFAIRFGAPSIVGK
jgi:hypothetical protein